MAEDNSNHSAVVVGVGASAGLGAALCRRFAKGGLHVFVAGRTQEKIDLIVAEIQANGGAATAHLCDTTDEDQVIALFDAAEGHGDGVILAAYNAGNNSRMPILEMTASWFEKTWRLACFGGFLCGREAARRLVPRGRGSLFFTGATASIRGKPPFTAFASAKAGLRSLAQAMARELGPQGIHVGHFIIDGGIDGEKLRSGNPDAVAARGEDGMLNPDDIAEAYWQMHLQPRSAWSFEWDLRPFKEAF
ncbi:MAG: SDR family NAD(P)-dependent oxidoreductase [Rhodospirillaceae bacterium]|jgi:NAD(P)-dependent dehydrogenase (short-subunit alcohol dehydrogenase family)|nr:SDR family NAD(P)-dependent oxidoreductase [Rhodospirillaceae bacterium]MBT5195124.1 SDR family NAD(P)-dependent oxidoreductase [Rhodospirillaceae bacterium]MBT5895087.1 SDR family NAD(P)-dependent oxidoreductase [Rhodospirillaceae bacterium]MBT6427800.1 SDR family NAD(P)-dependent oxidoreductase [Rhodospirillaceae bacterium]MBT7760644.1 SDR family NAD(P)-dependent oxidoreductase [Rhodospirillaceae bacterium]